MATPSTASGATEVNAAELLLMMSAGWNAPSPYRPSTAPAIPFPTTPVTAPAVYYPSGAASSPPPSALDSASSAPALRPRRLVGGSLPAWTDSPSSSSEEDEPRHRTKSRKSGIKDAVRKRVSSFKRLALPRTSNSNPGDMKKTGKKLLERLAVHLDLAFLDNVDGASALSPEQFAQLGLTNDELAYYHSRAERDKTKALFKIFFCQREALPIVPPEMACKRCKNDSWCCYLRKEMAHPRRGRKMKSCAGCHASKAECIWPNKQNEAPDYNHVVELNRSEQARATLPTPSVRADDLPRLSVPSTERKKLLSLPTPPPDRSPLLSHSPNDPEMLSPLQRASQSMPRGERRRLSITPSLAPSRDGPSSRASSLAPSLSIPHLLAPSPTRPPPRFLGRMSSPASFLASSEPPTSSPVSSKRVRSPSAEFERDHKPTGTPKRRRTVSPSSLSPLVLVDPIGPSPTRHRSNRNGGFWTVGSSSTGPSRSPRLTAQTRSPRPIAPAQPSRSIPPAKSPRPGPGFSRFLSPATDADYRTLLRRGFSLPAQEQTFVPRLKCTTCAVRKLTCAFIDLPQPRDGQIPLTACVESAATNKRSVWCFPVSTTTGTAHLSARVSGVLLPPTLHAIEEVGAWCDINNIKRLADDDVAAQLAHGLEDTPAFLSAVEYIHPHLRAIAPALELSTSPRPIKETERYLFAQGVNQHARAVHFRATWDGLDILKAVERILLSEITPALAQEVVSRLPGWDGEKVVTDDGDKVIRLIALEGEIGAAIEDKRSEGLMVYGHRSIIARPEFVRATKVECKRMDVMAVFGPPEGTRHWCASVIAHDQVILGEVLGIARNGRVEDVLNLVAEARRKREDRD